MTSDITNMEDFDFVFGPLTSDAPTDEVPEPIEQPELSPTFLRRFRAMAARTGDIDGVRALIEELRKDLFILRGFGKGWWELTGRPASFDQEADTTPEEASIRYTLMPIETGTAPSVDYERKHLILGMHSPQDADIMFSRTQGTPDIQWRATSIADPGVQIAATDLRAQTRT